jgi:hypothetical protein
MRFLKRKTANESAFADYQNPQLNLRQISADIENVVDPHPLADKSAIRTPLVNAPAN